MVYEIEFVDSGPFDVVVTTSGDATAEGFAEGRNRMSTDPRFRPGVNILVDHSRLEVVGMASEDVRTIAITSGRAYEALGVGYIAFVAPAAVQFGIARMWQTYTSEPLAERTTIVGSVAEAHAWIERQPPLPPPSA